MAAYEKLIYGESSSESEVEEEEEIVLEPSFKQIQHTEKEEKKEGVENIHYVRRYITKYYKKNIPPTLIANYKRKIIHLNFTLLKLIVEKKASFDRTDFTSVEQYRYFRFLEFLVLECDKWSS
jgi:hypothetical protein